MWKPDFESVQLLFWSAGSLPYNAHSSARVRASDDAHGCAIAVQSSSRVQGDMYKGMCGSFAACFFFLEGRTVERGQSESLPGLLFRFATKTPFLCREQHTLNGKICIHVFVVAPFVFGTLV